MWFGVVTLFPEVFQLMEIGVIGRALQQKIIQLQLFNPRDYTQNKHRTVDDKPFGGGPGMLMKPEPLHAALLHAKASAPSKPKTIYLSPQGKRFDQTAAEDFAQDKSLVLLTGRYEGIDERIIELDIDEEWSLGDFIVSGGELPALMVMDAISRLIPGVLGDPDSASQDSYTGGLLKYPQYTRPAKFEGLTVPSVLINGDHHKINEWRLKHSLGRTMVKRPDLLKDRPLSPLEKDLLEAYLNESKNCSTNNK